MELKDIVLKKGDIVTLDDGEIQCFYPDNNFGLFADDVYDKKRIVKIERPIKYETIYEASKVVLDKEEKEYLEHFLRPFRNRVKWIAKYESYKSDEYIAIQVKDERYLELPDFKKETMYKGMELNKEYTLDELGLFKE